MTPACFHREAPRARTGEESEREMGYMYELTRRQMAGIDAATMDAKGYVEDPVAVLDGMTEAVGLHTGHREEAGL